MQICGYFRVVTKEQLNDERQHHAPKNNVKGAKASQSLKRKEFWQACGQISHDLIHNSPTEICHFLNVHSAIHAVYAITIDNDLFSHLRIRQIGYIDHSWRLVATDAIPTSKRKGEALRDLEKKIQGAKYEEIDLYAAQHITVAEYVQKSLGYKIHYKQTTKNTRRVYFKNCIENRIGRLPLSTIKYTDIKQFYLLLVIEDILKISSIAGIDAILKGAFNLAVRDGIIRNNPADGVLREIK